MFGTSLKQTKAERSNPESGFFLSQNEPLGGWRRDRSVFRELFLLSEIVLREDLNRCLYSQLSFVILVIFLWGTPKISAYESRIYWRISVNQWWIRTKYWYAKNVSTFRDRSRNQVPSFSTIHRQLSKTKTVHTSEEWISVFVQLSLLRRRNLKKPQTPQVFEKNQTFVDCEWGRPPAQKLSHQVRC